MTSSPIPIAQVLASDTTKYGYASTIRGIEEAARAAGFLVMITVIESEDDVAVQRSVVLPRADTRAAATGIEESGILLISTGGRLVLPGGEQ